VVNQDAARDAARRITRAALSIGGRTRFLDEQDERDLGRVYDLLVNIEERIDQREADAIP